MTIAAQLKNKLKAINLNGKLILIIASSENYNEANLEAIKYLSTDKKLAGVYVTVNKPYQTIKTILENAGVNTKTMIFIDAISKLTSSSIGRVDNVLFINDPSDLTGISIAMSEAIKILPKKDKFLFFDSLSTLSIYNSSGSVTKFAHFLITNMRMWGVTGIIMSIEKEADKGFINQLIAFSDLTIELGGEK